jgi:hypothetical protein
MSLGVPPLHEKQAPHSLCGACFHERNAEAKPVYGNREAVESQSSDPRHLAERMETTLALIASLALLAASAGLLRFGRGRDGKSRPIFRKNWILAQLYAATILCSFFGGLCGVILSWPLSWPL